MSENSSHFPRNNETACHSIQLADHMIKVYEDQKEHYEKKAKEAENNCIAFKRMKSFVKQIGDLGEIV